MANILHIEDDPQSLLLVRKLLSAGGHRVIETPSGIEGARLATEQRPDLVLVDINIPDLDGYEVALLLRGRLPGVPLVAITAEGDRQTAMAVGFDGFLSKPIDVGTFTATLEGFLRGAREPAGEHAAAPALLAQGQRIAARLEAKVHELSDANDRLLDADRLRREFYRNVSHELATPLTPLVGYLGLLAREELGPLKPPQARALAAMDEALGRLRRTIGDLLDVTQLETGRMRFTFANYDYGRVVRAAGDARRDEFARAGVELVEDLPREALPCVGDADRVARAAAHLLDNALKFSPAGGAVAVEVRASSTHCELLVSDSGEGVPEQWLARIFDPFVQADGSPTRRHGGAGIGLSVVRGVAEAHGGGALAEAGGRFPVAGRKLPGLLVRMKLSRAPDPEGAAR